MTLKADLRDERGILFCRKCFQCREKEGGDSPHRDGDVYAYSDVEEPNTLIPEEPMSPTSPIQDHQGEYPEEEEVTQEEEEVPQPVAKDVIETQHVEGEQEPVEEQVEEEEEPSALPVPFYEPDDEEVVQLEEVNICSRGERLFTCPRCRLQVIVQNLTGMTVCLKCKAPVCLACGKLGGHPGYCCK